MFYHEMATMTSLLMENTRWISGLILLFHLALSLENEVPEVTQCQFLNAATVKCKWEHTSEYSDLILLYTKASDRPDFKGCFHKCSEIQQDTDEQGNIYDFCEFDDEASLSEKYMFYLAESSRCELVREDCTNCTGRMGKEKFYHSSIDLVELTVPASDFRVENLTVKWSPPKVNQSSMISYLLDEREAFYKLIYRKIACPQEPTQQLNQTWKVWYEGNKLEYTPRNLDSGCKYKAKLFVWLAPTEGHHHNITKWGPQTNTIQIVAPIIHHVATTVPKVTQCQSFNAATVKCKWEHSTEYNDLLLLYTKASDHPNFNGCFHKCSEIQQETDEQGNIYDFCEFDDEAALSVKYDFYLAEANRCELVLEDCTNCTGRIGQKKFYKTATDSVILTVPASDFRVENLTVKWSPPKVNQSSMISFLLHKREAFYKLIYRKIACPHASTLQLNQTWKVWYVGNKLEYRPRNLVSGCKYEAKLFVWLAPTEEHINNFTKWGPQTNTIQIVAPIIHHVATTESMTTEMYFNKAEKHSLLRNIFLGVIAVILFAFVVCLFIFRKHLPTKTAVPKPILMISLEDLKTNFNAHWENDKEDEAATFLPDIVSRVMHENNHIFKKFPLQNGNSNSFQLLIETGNGSIESNSQPGRNLVSQSNNTSSDRNHLLSNEETLPLSSIPATATDDESKNEFSHAKDDTFELNGEDVKAPPVSAKCNKNPLKLTTSTTLVDPTADQNRDAVTSDVVLGLSNETKLECCPDQRDPDSLSPQTTSSGFAEYMDYVTDTSGIPSSSGGAAFFPDDQIFDAQSLSNDFPTYLEQFSRTDDVPMRCCHGNSVESASIAYSSLPSVTGEYVLECCNDDSARQDLFYRTTSRSACPNCKKQYVVKRPFYEQKRKSLGEHPFNFEAIKSDIFKNRPSGSTDTLSLDSGCSPDLVVLS